MTDGSMARAASGLALQMAWLPAAVPIKTIEAQAPRRRPQRRGAIQATAHRMTGHSVTADVVALLRANRGVHLTLGQLHRLLDGAVERCELSSVLRKLAQRPGAVDVARRHDGRRWVWAYRWADCVDRPRVQESWLPQGKGALQRQSISTDMLGARTS